MIFQSSVVDCTKTILALDAFKNKNALQLTHDEIFWKTVVNMNTRQSWTFISMFVLLYLLTRILSF